MLLGLSIGYAAKLDFRQKDFSNGLKNIRFETFQKLLSASIIDNLETGPKPDKNDWKSNDLSLTYIKQSKINIADS